LTKRLSLAIPEPIGAGRPSSTYPFAWGLCRWIDGQPYSNEGVEDERQAARDLARFVLELRRLDTSGAPPAGRKPLLELDADTRSAIEAADSFVDARGASDLVHDADRGVHDGLIQVSTMGRARCPRCSEIRTRRFDRVPGARNSATTPWQVDCQSA
jgi:hypothetical protein